MNRVLSVFRRWFGSVAPVSGCRALLPVLLASERDDDFQNLQALLHNTKWSVERAKSWSDVSGFCDRVVNQVVLLDRHFQGSDWRRSVSSLPNPDANRCLILLSDVSDPYLWNELVQHGGFDVLARPFESSALFRTLAFAQRHCEAGWPPLPQEKGGSPTARSK
jgi:FixJ family two-component response regulator